MSVPRRHSDQMIYAAAARLGDQTVAAHELGLSPTYVSKRVRAYAAVTGLPVPANRGGHPMPVVRIPAPDLWSHRRVRDGGVRVRDQRRALA